MIKHRICFTFLVFVFLTSCAQNPRTNEKARPQFNSSFDAFFVETTDTISRYGPQNITRNILQARDGTIWFASWEGMVRYDGKWFTYVTIQKKLKPFRVFSLLEDKQGNVWFGTIGAGVYKYDGKLFANFTEQNGLAANGVMCMVQDKSGNIWFGTDKGASRYDGRSFLNFTVNDGLVSNSINSICQDRTGRLWFGTNAGVSIYDGKSFAEYKNNEGYTFANVRSIVEDKTGNIWIGSQDGLYNTKSRSAITESFIGNIFEDKTGRLWLSAADTAHGMDIMSFDGQPVRKNNGMVLYRYNGYSLERIFENDNQVFGVTEDKARNIWFGTAEGIRRYDGRQFEDFKKK
jgi:ligand-binding sensor domain-containing protein